MPLAVDHPAVGCNKRLDFMLQHNFTAPLTHPVGISNDVMAAVPGDAYLAHSIRRLASWNHWLFMKYIQVSGRCCRGRACTQGD